MKCNKCNKEMQMPDGTEVVGISILFTDDTENKEYGEFVQKQLGKFEVGKKYQMCYECWLDSMGFVP